jgi:hypothetical protein
MFYITAGIFKVYRQMKFKWNSFPVKCCAKFFGIPSPSGVRINIERKKSNSGKV